MYKPLTDSLITHPLDMEILGEITLICLCVGGFALWIYAICRKAVADGIKDSQPWKLYDQEGKEKGAELK